MIDPKHIPILHAKDGECDGLSNLDRRTADRVRPLFEVDPITDSVRERRYFRESDAPITAYLDRTLGRVSDVWRGRLAMVDAYQWPAAARTEEGIHVISYVVRRLRSSGVPVIPVIGYDRWENDDYRAGVRSISGHDGSVFCLRLDSIAIEDAAEPDHFVGIIEDIVETLGLFPNICWVLVDFGDVSTDAVSLEHMIERTEAIVDLLSDLGFERFIVAGCSLPRSIDQAVSHTDSEDVVLRKESLAWKALREGAVSTLVSGDYGVRGPTTSDIRSTYINGKIRYTIEGEIYVVRGHAFRLDHDYSQMRSLAQVVVDSEHFLGAAFSWGDSQIDGHRIGGRTGDNSHWIAVDTNHHLTFVVQEVEEYERGLEEVEEPSGADR